MPKNLGSKCTKCRREGTKLFLKGEKCFSPKCPIIKRNYPPGVHGPKSKSRLTEYGTQLREKQKAKRIYGLREQQFKNYYEKAIKKQGDTGEILNQLLELRLDNVIYRLGFAKSRAAARQLVSHGYFLVNSKKVNIPSFQLKPKDEISLKAQKATTKIVTELNLEKKEVPIWLFLDAANLKAKVVNKPKANDIQQIFNPRLIVEFYSR